MALPLVFDGHQAAVLVIGDHEGQMVGEDVFHAGQRAGHLRPRVPVEPENGPVPADGVDVGAESAGVEDAVLVEGERLRLAVLGCQECQILALERAALPADEAVALPDPLLDPAAHHAVEHQRAQRGAVGQVPRPFLNGGNRLPSRIATDHGKSG
ncbi:hypothetical protein [[Actinomadura] parvosata]|uniref:hypothetical protein n=1 Tax=[Actinomadura] parvosata TaxID=1955412 RepID=UPI00164722E7